MGYTKTDLADVVLVSSMLGWLGAILFLEALFDPMSEPTNWHAIGGFAYTVAVSTFLLVLPNLWIREGGRIT